MTHLHQLWKTFPVIYNKHSVNSRQTCRDVKDRYVKYGQLHIYPVPLLQQSVQIQHVHYIHW